MGAVVGLGVGIGLLLVWSAFVLPTTERLAAAEPAAPYPRRGRARPPWHTTLVAMCLLLGLGAGVVIQLATDTLPVALCFASSAAAALPRSLPCASALT